MKTSGTSEEVPGDFCAEREGVLGWSGRNQPGEMGSLAGWACGGSRPSFNPKILYHRIYSKKILTHKVNLMTDSVIQYILFTTVRPSILLPTHRPSAAVHTSPVQSSTPSLLRPFLGFFLFFFARQAEQSHFGVNKVAAVFPFPSTPPRGNQVVR